jgi:hypothetical protein
MPTPPRTFCAENIVDPDSGEVHEWAGQYVDGDDAATLWSLVVQKPEAFFIDPVGTEEVVVRNWRSNHLM